MASDEVESLRSEITRLLAAADRAEVDFAEAERRAEEAHEAEIEEILETAGRLVESMARDEVEACEAQLAQLRQALRSRDLIGQAKGVLMVVLLVNPDKAFAVMVQQSQYENRKLVEVAAEIVERARSRAERH